MNDGPRSALRAAAIAAFAVGVLLMFLHPPSLSGAGGLATLFVAVIAFFLIVAWATVALIGRDGITEENVAQHLLDITKAPSETGHVYTLHAELEGQKWMPIFEQLLQGWRDQGYEFVSMQQYLQEFKVADLPLYEVKPGTVEGRSGTLAVQSPDC